MEQILQSLNLGTLRGRFEAQQIEPQAVLNLMEKNLGKNLLFFAFFATQFAIFPNFFPIFF